jgi:phenylacetate-coenzyme A ligase PaaK-like adenylate-forming protein
MGWTFWFLRQILRLRHRNRQAAERTLALQESRLNQLLSYVADRSPFYHEHFRGIDLQRCRLSDLPPLSKAEAMDRFDALVTDRRITRAGVEDFLNEPTNQGQLYLGRYAVCHTSGSQGQPALVVQDCEDLLLAFAVQIARGQLRHPLSLACRRFWKPARMAVVTQRPGFYPSGSMFSYLEAARLPFLRLPRLSVFDEAPDLVARLNDFQPNYLIGYTSSLEILAREERVGRLRLRQARCLEQITNISEPLPATSRSDIEEAFGTHIADHYALAECMALTSGCPVAAGSHVNADLACLEVVDDDYHLVPDGVAGSKVLITNLYNWTQPLIRYEVGDVVTLDPTPCPCGSSMPHIQSIAGRTKEKLWIEVEGEYRELSYYVFLAALHHCLELAEHQVVQTGRNCFVIRVAPQPGKVVSPQRVKQLIYQSVTAEGLAGILEVKVEVVADIRPDSRTGKRTRVLSLVGPPVDGAAAKAALAECGTP